MNARTRLSAKGQVVVPKDVRDVLGWPVGQDLDVIVGDDEVTFRRRSQKTLSVEEAVAVFRSLYRHQGPPVTLEQMKIDAQDEAVARYDRT